MSALIEALTLQAGYNAALVTVGAAALGMAAGITGSFLYLRERALISDAISHATLPGVCLAFMVMVALGLDGRALLGLMAGSAVSAALGLWLIAQMTRHTRLSEDAAIGAVLSVFFGAGIVALTVIQTMTAGRKAGLESFLLGSTAGMLRQDALIIAIGGALVCAAVLILRRPLLMTAFDPGFARAIGLRPERIDAVLMALVTAVVVVGLKIVGLILIIALLIIPPVAARFWTNRGMIMAWCAGGIGAASGWLGAALSASAPDLPTGPLIVLSASAMFLVSMLVAPARGVVAGIWRRQRFAALVHRRQGLLALSRGEPILERFTLLLLRRAGLIRADGVATPEGRSAAARAARDELRWQIARRRLGDADHGGRYNGLTPIEQVFTADEIAELDRLASRQGRVR